MKKNRLTSTRLIVGLSAIALVSLFASLAHAQGKQNFTLVNKTGQAINELYVSKASTDDWEEDILGRDTLANGDSVEITFSPKERAAKWDIKLIDDKGKEHKYFNLNLLEISEITVRSNGDGTWHWNWK
jgi:hypothetical protein